MKKLLKNPEFLVGSIIIIITILIAIFAPYIANYSYDTLTEDLLHAPSSEHYFGTDNLGRDIFSMTIYGTRASLYVGITAAIISSILGVAIGALSG